MSKDNSKKDSLNNSHDSAKEMLIGDYIIKKTIGTGTFSVVKLGIHRITQKKVAIKILDKNKIESKDDLERIVREMQILTEMNHQNVIKVFKIYEEENNFSLIMEYCEEGELFNYIVKNQRLSEDETSYFFYQIINGIEYIHSKGIAHRDLKPENLLIGKNKILKIIDFGLSNFYDGTKRLQTPCGSPCYASPEMVKGKKYDGFNIDIWAIGVILFAMLCGYLPFEDDENDNDVLFSQIIKNKIEYPPFLSELSLDILKKILVSDPLKRINIDEIKKHEFYLKGEKIYNEKFNKKEDNTEIKESKIIDKVKKASKSENDYEKKVLQTTINEKENKNHQNILFLDYLKSERANKKNNIKHKAPITITLNKGENNDKSNIQIKNSTINNTQNNTLNNSKKNINHKDKNVNSIKQKKIDYTKYCRTNENLDYNKKTNYLINDNHKGKEGLINLFGIKPKKKLFTKLEIKNHKDKIFGVRNGVNNLNDDNTNRLNIREKPYKLNLDIIKNNKNSFEKQNHRFNDEFNNNNYEKNFLYKKNNINNLKIINTKAKSKEKDNNSLKNKLLKYNIMELKQYNRLVNQINININNISRSVQKTQLENYTKQNFANNNVINLNVILNDNLNNNNKNLESLQVANNTINNIKKNLPATPSQIRFIPSKKSTLPSITISDRIKPKITSHKFKSINNSKYLNTESNYDRIERQKRIFLDNVNKKHEFLRLNYPRNYRINANIYNY